MKQHLVLFIYNSKHAQSFAILKCDHHHLSILVIEGVAEMAAVTVGTCTAREDHPADLGLVAWVPHHRTQLPDAVSELAVVSVGTCAALLPLVAKLRLQHPLIVSLHFHGGSCGGCTTSLFHLIPLSST